MSDPTPEPVSVPNTPPVPVEPTPEDVTTHAEDDDPESNVGSEVAEDA